MSKLLVNLVYAKVIGSSSRKAVLVSMADRANDDGSAVYVSKSRIAAETELSRATVVRVTQSFEKDGILSAVGKRVGNHGYTVVYHLSVSKIHELPDAWSKCTNLDTLDEGLGEDGQDTEFEVSNHATLPVIQVLQTPLPSVAPCDKNRPYRTLDKIPSEIKTKRTSGFARWEANRCRVSDPDRCKALEAEAAELLQQEIADEKAFEEKKAKARERKAKAKGDVNV